MRREDDTVVLLGNGTTPKEVWRTQCTKNDFFTKLDPEIHSGELGRARLLPRKLAFLQKTQRGVWTGNFTREIMPPDGKWQALRAR
jgi:hypothetical protein